MKIDVEVEFWRKKRGIKDLGIRNKSMDNLKYSIFFSKVSIRSNEISVLVEICVNGRIELKGEVEID